MVNSVDLEDDDFPEGADPGLPLPPDSTGTPKALTPQCLTCNGTGAVPENILNGKVDKWKDCPMCGGKGNNPLSNSDFNKCKECNGAGQIVKSFVDGVPVSHAQCSTCKGSGTSTPNE